jgi:DNA-binding CsgD family transcriptional regulator
LSGAGAVDAIRHSSYRLPVARLAEPDYRKALDVLYVAGEVEGPVAFPEPVLETLRALVSCDVVTFHERSTDADRVVVYSGEPVAPVVPEIRSAHRRFKHQDPLRTFVAAARTLTDVISMRAFRRSDFYLHVHRPLGIEHMLQLYVDPSVSDARLEFDRSETDFSERDREILDLLRPHLATFARAARRRHSHPSGAQSLTTREREVVAHVADGRTNGEIGHLLGISPQTVRTHLEHAYGKLGVHTRTAAVAAAFGRPPTGR